MNSRAPTFRNVLRNPINLAVLALMAGASAAHAQGAAQPASAASAAAASRDDGVQEVTVTATKRTTTLQSTPLAVTPINAAELDKQHVQTMEDIVHLVPSFQATTEGDHGVITMTMRGIGNDSAKTEYADPEVALFVDGIYAPRAEGAAALLFDMDGIEVLRGPQGTLWGRNSTVGAVNMKTAKPEIGSNFGNIEAGLGNFNRVGARGAFNLSLSDTFAIRAAFVHEQHDGYVNYQKAPNVSLDAQHAAADPYITTWNADPKHANDQISFRPMDPNTFVQTGPKYDAQDQTAERLSFLWKPMRNLSWNASYEHFEDHGTPNINLMQDPRPGESFWSSLVSVAPYLDRSVNTFRSHVSWDLSDYLNLNYTAGYSKYSGIEDFDQSGGATIPTSFTTGASVVQEDRTDWSHYKNYSHELQLQSSGSHEVDWILGLYYAAEDNGIRFDIPQSNGTQQGTIGWQGAFIQPKETVNSDAVFGQATWNIGDKLHLTGGARFTHDDRKDEGGVNWGWTGNGPNQLPVDPGTNPADEPTAWSATHDDGHYKGSKTTWLARANYDITKDAMVYASVSTGYKSGGVQDGGFLYQPETLTNYEVGSKNTFLGGKVHFNNSLYYEDFKSFQFDAPVTNPDGSHGLAISNAKGAKVYGFETELSAALTKNDTISISGAYLHTRLGYLLAGSNDYSLPACTESTLINNCLNVTGHKLPHSPTLSGTAMYEHDFRFASGSKLSPRITFHYEGRSTLSVFDLGAPDEQKAYTRTDLGLRWQDAKDWYVDAFVRNVEDARIKTNAANSFGGTWESQYLPPRTFGVNVGMNF